MMAHRLSVSRHRVTDQRPSWEYMCGTLLVVAVSLLLAGRATGAPPRVAFSGELQRVTDLSISVRLTDGRIIEARDTTTRGELAPRSLAKRYAVGDLVKIDCVRIGGVYGPLIGRRLYLELKKLQFIRGPTSEEESKALTSRAWRQAPNLLRADPPWQPVQGESQPSSLPPAEHKQRAGQPTGFRIACQD